jgi:hypothetical protein
MEKEVMKTTVVNIKEMPLYDVYIGRGGRWGNPFKIGVDGTREEVIEKYKVWILSQPPLLNEISQLRGKVLGCWCKPKACHGDVIVELLEKSNG